jgi:hypothetical protein
MKQAEWIANQMDDANADDVFDVLLGTITEPSYFVKEVEEWAKEYELDFRRHNVG